MPRLPVTELLSEHRPLLHPRVQAPLEARGAETGEAERLAAFFARLSECREKATLTHGLHPYPAKFIPHIPRELVESLSRPGDLVWDPMCGSGTTLVEAAVAGRDAVGSDVNPVAVLASEAKTTALTRADLDELRGLELDLRVGLTAWPSGHPDEHPEIPEFRNREKWFEPGVARELGSVRSAIEGVRSGAARRLAACAFSAIIVAVSNQEGETRWRSRPASLEPGEVRARFLAKLRASIAAVGEYGRRAAGAVSVQRRDVREAAALPRPADLIITSPPYANAHDYYLYNKLRMFWLGEDVASVRNAEIGSRHRHSDRGEGIGAYTEAMGAALESMRAALRPGGRLAMVVADGVIDGVSHPMDRLIPEVAASRGLRLERSYSFDHRQFNTGQHNGFAGVAGARKPTHVLVLG